jgi:hypothetical protein
MRPGSREEHATSGRKLPPTAGATAATTGTGQAAKAASVRSLPIFQALAVRSPKAAAVDQNSMFMPSKKLRSKATSAAAGPVKPVVKQRCMHAKAGAAQMLLNQGKRNRMNTMAGSSTAASTAAVSGVRGRANKLGNNKSE